MATKRAAKENTTTVELIRPYKVIPVSCGDENNQWEAKARTFKPFSKVPAKIRAQMDAYVWLDAITHPIEAGVVPQDGWVKFLFGSEKVFFEFIGAYTGYDDMNRTNDRWYRALQELSGGQGEETGFVRSDEICDELITHATETGQISAK